MATYKSAYSGPQIDEAIGKALNPDAAPTPGSTNLVMSGGVASAVQNTVSRRNLLDNWYFVGGGSQQGGGRFPINQRGNTSYSGAVYGIDRWKGNNWTATANITVQSGSILLSGTASGANSCMIQQTIENAAQFAGKKVTVSVLVGAVSGSKPRIWIRTNTNERFAAVTLASNGLYSVTAVLPDDITQLLVQIGQHASDGGNGNTSIEIIAVKLELGDTQTLAHQENGVWVLNDIPNYTEELLKCQRYFLRIKGYYTAYQTASSAVPYQLFVQFPVVMRAIPTISNVAYVGSAQASEIDAGYSSMVRFYSTSGGFALDSFNASADL